eukprot:14441523-Alexandrium_andersonii.AAC.1
MLRPPPTGLPGIWKKDRWPSNASMRRSWTGNIGQWTGPKAQFCGRWFGPRWAVPSRQPGKD